MPHYNISVMSINNNNNNNNIINNETIIPDEHMEALVNAANNADLAGAVGLSNSDSDMEVKWVVTMEDENGIETEEIKWLPAKFIRTEPSSTITLEDEETGDSLEVPVSVIHFDDDPAPVHACILSEHMLYHPEIDSNLTWRKPGEDYDSSDSDSDDDSYMTSASSNTVLTLDKPPKDFTDTELWAIGSRIFETIISEAFNGHHDRFRRLGPWTQSQITATVQEKMTKLKQRFVTEIRKLDQDAENVTITDSEFADIVEQVLFIDDDETDTGVTEMIS